MIEMILEQISFNRADVWRFTPSSVGYSHGKAIAREDKETCLRGKEGWCAKACTKSGKQIA